MDLKYFFNISSDNLRDALYELQQIKKTASKSIEQWLKEATNRLAVENVRLLAGYELKKYG